MAARTLRGLAAQQALRLASIGQMLKPSSSRCSRRPIR
jgi:hypothetical protein